MIANGQGCELLLQVTRYSSGCSFSLCYETSHGVVYHLTIAHEGKVCKSEKLVLLNLFYNSSLSFFLYWALTVLLTGRRISFMKKIRMLKICVRNSIMKKNNYAEMLSRKQHYKEMRMLKS